MGNDPLDAVDGLGLMKRQNIMEKVKLLNIALQATMCCCTNKEASKAVVDIRGTASGSTVAVTATLIKYGYVLDIYGYYWWDCYSPAAERSLWYHDDWKQWGWSDGDQTYTKTASPGFWAFLGFYDPYHIAVESTVVFIWCARNHHEYASYANPNYGLVLTWNKKTKSWTGPAGYR